MYVCIHILSFIVSYSNTLTRESYLACMDMLFFFSKFQSLKKLNRRADNNHLQYNAKIGESKWEKQRQREQRTHPAVPKQSCLFCGTYSVKPKILFQA